MQTPQNVKSRAAGTGLEPDRRALAGIFLLLLALVSDCAAERPFVWVREVPISGDTSSMIEPRDTILVSVRNQVSLSGEFVVGDHGEYSQPVLGIVNVRDKTTDAVAADLQVRLAGLLAKPEVSVSIIKIATVRVNVVGEVKTPGTYELMRGRGVIPALAAAGWLTEFANRDRIFVIRADGAASQSIRFRAAELTAAEPHATGFRLRDGDVVVVE
jgi:polysaccharide export outer membrane protein